MSNDLTKAAIIDAIGDSESAEVEKFAAYCIELRDEVHKSGDKKGQKKNWWMKNNTPESLAALFNRVKAEGLEFDGKHVTLNQRGINYDYIAYKNKMLIAYPETVMDVELVYEGDVFNIKKDSGKVAYSHDFADPFSRTEEKIKGGYCVIKNKRGEFITILNRKEFEKHRNVAKTDYIWMNWYREMCLKTVVKKACKIHFDDVYKTMEEDDNENYDTDLVNAPLSHKQEIEKIDTLDELKVYWEEHKGLGKDFAKLVTMRKQEILDREKLSEPKAAPLPHKGEPAKAEVMPAHIGKPAEATPLTQDTNENS